MVTAGCIMKLSTIASNDIFLSSTKRISYRIKVEVERSPSVHCHKEKLDDVCATEYKETKVD